MRRSRMVSAWCSILAGMLVSLGLSSPSPLTISVSPHIGRSPQDVRVTTKVAPDERNRSLCIEIDGPQYRSSCWELPGKDAPITTETWLKSFPGGAYEVRVTLGRIEDGKRVEITRSDRLCVVGGVREAESGCGEGSEGGSGWQD